MFFLSQGGYETSIALFIFDTFSPYTPAFFSPFSPSMHSYPLLPYSGTGE
jgi:hypothetical protein